MYERPRNRQKCGSAWQGGGKRIANSVVADLNTHVLINKLRNVRARLIQSYALHVVWFTTMCCFTGFHWNQHGLKASVFLTLVTVPPVLFYTVRTHTLCRAIDPRSRTVGLVPVILTTIILSPFESGLLLPAKNLLVANRLLRLHAAALRPVSNEGSHSPEAKPPHELA